jgi:hypothetical protein
MTSGDSYPGVGNFGGTGHSDKVQSTPMGLYVFPTRSTELAEILIR